MIKSPPTKSNETFAGISRKTSDISRNIRKSNKYKEKHDLYKYSPGILEKINKLQAKESLNINKKIKTFSVDKAVKFYLNISTPYK